VTRVWIIGATIAIASVAACGTNGGPSSCPADEPASCPSPAPSYASDVAPLIQQYCISGCHNPNGSGSTVLASWADIHVRVTTVYDQIYQCKMPLAGSPEPTDAERVLLLSWFVCGSPNN